MSTAYGWVMDKLIRLPRLTRLVRESFWHPEDSALIAETLKLVEEVYVPETAQMIETLIQSSATVCAAQANDQLALSYRFGSVHVFALAIYFYAYRCLTFGLIQRLSLHPGTSFLQMDLAEIQAENIRVSTGIVMSVDYAILPESEPWAMFKIMRPLCVAYAGWKRLESRAGDDAPVLERAVCMKEFCLKTAVQIANRLSTKLHELAVWDSEPEMVSETFVGGAAVPFLSMSSLRTADCED